MVLVPQLDLCLIPNQLVFIGCDFYCFIGLRSCLMMVKKKKSIVCRNGVELTSMAG